MDLVKQLERVMTSFGAGWVMWLLIGLSVISVAIMLERIWFFFSIRDDLGQLQAQLRERLRKNDIEGAIQRMKQSPSAEAAVVTAGLLEADRGPHSADEAMKSAAALQRMKLEKRLSYLGTLGNNAPFIGLLGTVIGIVAALKELGSQDVEVAAAAASAGVTANLKVMAAIGEALVATAVGIAVAIPAVAMFNYFKGMAKNILANTEALSHVLLAHLMATEEVVEEEVVEGGLAEAE